MRISVGDERFRLVFRYEWQTPDGPVGREYSRWAPVTAQEAKHYRRPEKIFHRVTRAELLKEIGTVSGTDTAQDGKPAYELVGSGEARCSPQDAYNKESGRKRALKRMLESETRKFRGAIWDGYFDRLPKAPSWEAQERHAGALAQETQGS